MSDTQSQPANGAVESTFIPQFIRICLCASSGLRIQLFPTLGRVFNPLSDVLNRSQTNLMANRINNLRFGEFTLHVELRQLRRGDEVLPVVGKAFDLLVYMASNPSRPLLKAELLQAIWPDSFVEESNLTQNVFLLRKVLGGGPGGAIVTLPGRGYQFAANVTDLTVTKPDPDPATVGLAASSFTAIESIRTRILLEDETEEHIAPWRSPWVLSLSAVGVLLLVVASWLGYQRWQDRVSGPPVQVVLTDFDGSTGDLLLDHSLVDALRIDLSQSPFVTVVSPALISQTLVHMQHKPDERLTANLARDLCERIASQVVLHGTVARAGSRYLLTEEATNCADGSLTASSKMEAARPEDLPHALDRLAAEVRSRLGESRRTIARFNAPLFPENTGSLDALKDLSQALALSQRGKLTEAIGLLKNAVGIDPNFAAAWFAMANFYANLGDQKDQIINLQRAYDLRDNASAPQRLYISARYHSTIDGDLYEALNDYKTMTQIYPRNPAALSGVLEVDRLLGHYANGIDVGKRLLSVAPNYVTIYYGLCEMQAKAGLFTEALATCRLAIRRGFDGDLIRAPMFEIAVDQHDEASMEVQRQYAASHPEAHYLAFELCRYDISMGRFAVAREELAVLTTNLNEANLAPLAAADRMRLATELGTLGYVSEARQLFNPATVTPEDIDGIEALYSTGDTQRALALIRTELSQRPHAVLWKDILGPLALAHQLLAQNKPQASIDALVATADVPEAFYDATFLRAQADLALHQPSAAEASFRQLLAQPQVDPVTSEALLAWIGLTQSLAAQHRNMEARATWQHMQALYAHSDPGVLDTASHHYSPPDS
jgi:DNA-binding winged helix-turn-helix (wHTH) protein/tetratricopeptide (TPR) repeat protein